jgi:phospholipid/cholesterol/gamma-HCH transport system ATP-binding protein
MGMLFQGSALFDSMNVGENVAFYLRQHEPNLPDKELKNRVAEALEMVDMAGTQNKMPSDLSGGMRKRAALARLIIYRPRIVLYDEPTTGLDPITAMQINNLIINAQRKLQATSIVVTHDIKSAVVVGDRLALHYDKNIAYIAKKEEFLKIRDPKIQTFFENAAISKEFLANIKNGST